MTADHLPMVIVGSRLQALIFGVVGVAIPLGLWEQIGAWSLAAAIPFGVAAALTMHRRVELHADHAVVRHQFRRAATWSRSDLRASTGHRYLRIDAPDRRMRIEVPVEIRPEVRSWAEAS